jgi:hypothetical protein
MGVPHEKCRVRMAKTSLRLPLAFLTFLLFRHNLRIRAVSVGLDIPLVRMRVQEDLVARRIDTRSDSCNRGLLYRGRQDRPAEPE